jgi:hypothetical protein
VDRNPYAAPASELENPTQGTVSMPRYGVLCFVVLLVILTAYVLVSRLAGFPVWQGVGIIGFLAAVQFTSWRFVRTHRRVMSPLELKRFAITCAVAFWVFDEGSELIALIRTPGDQPIRAAVTWALGSGFDVALAAAIVYVTVPWMARYFTPPIANATDRSQHGNSPTRPRP